MRPADAMSERAKATARRRRARAEERARLWREHVCGGPLVDQAAPVVDTPFGRTGLGHAVYLAEVLAERQAAIARELDLLAAAFAHGCAARQHVREAMLADFRHWQEQLGQPGSVPTHSTAPAATGTKGIPAL
jgi:hypothetical protein